MNQFKSSPLSVFLIFLRLGMTSFGGSVAHLAYFRHEFVHKRKWLNEHGYADLVALCQFLPGPDSSQVGIALGLNRAGIAGAIAAFIGFTLPSALVLALLGLGVAHLAPSVHPSWLHGLQVVAVPIVGHALLSMGQTLAADRQRATILVAACIAALAVPTAIGPILIIAVSGIFGWLFLRSDHQLDHLSMSVPLGRKAGAALLILFFFLLAALPLANAVFDNELLRQFDSFYRAGALVFGGGHVVLPLLQSEVVATGWVDSDQFLAGYGAAQAVPGPIFTFATYLGMVSGSERATPGWLAGLVATIGIFLPAFLVILGALPFWETLRRFRSIRRAMLAINAAVVGILLAAFYNPLWVKGILSAADFSLAILAFLALAFWKWPTWLVVAMCAAGMRFLNA